MVTPLAALSPIYPRLTAALLVWASATIAVLAVLAGIVAWWARARGGRIADWRAQAVGWATGIPERPREWLWIIAAIALLLALADGQAFVVGFFRNDDFAFVGDTRAGLPAAQYLRLVHADHHLPLFRVEVLALVRLFGPNASANALAAAFNGLTAGTFAVLLAAGCWLLVEMRVRRLIILLFVAFTWTWPAWGEFTAGFYTIGAYPQTGALGLLAAAMLARGARLHRPGWSVAALVPALLAVGIDVSGLWVVPVVAALALAFSGGPGAIGRGFVIAAAAATLLVAGYLLLMSHEFGGRELVQNPQARTVASTVRGNLLANGARMPILLTAGVGSMFLTAVVPPEATLILRHAPVAGLSTVAIALEGLLGLALAGGISHLWRRLPQADRRIALALWSAPLVLLAITVAARAHGLNGPTVFWAAKYRAVPYCWSVLAACFLLDRRFATAAVPSGRWVAATAIAGGMAVWSLLPQWQIERCLAVRAPYLPGGRYGNVEQAQMRRAAFGKFEQDIRALARRTGRNRIPVPPEISGYWVYPSLEFGSDSREGSNYLFSDLMDVAPGTGIRLEIVAPSDVPPDVRAAIDAIPRLRALFSPPPS